MVLKITRNCSGWLSQRLTIVAYLAAENLALRQQLIVLKKSQKRPKLKERDRLFWVVMPRTWSGWRNALLIVQPKMAVRWHKKAFNLYWPRKSQGASGRLTEDLDVKAIILKMADANPLGGCTQDPRGTAQARDCSL